MQKITAYITRSPVSFLAYLLMLDANWMELQCRTAAAQSLGLDTSKIRPLSSTVRHTRWSVHTKCMVHLQNLIQVVLEASCLVLQLLKLSHQAGQLAELEEAAKPQ